MTQATVIRRPGGELSTRPLHFMWICDCSGSMASGGKIQTLNTESSRITCTVEKFLGAGGQGEVYQANLGGKPIALNGIFPTTFSKIRNSESG